MNKGSWSTGEVWAAIGVSSVAVGVIGCAGGGVNRTAVEYRQSVVNMQALNTGVLEYMNDYDDVFPQPGTWMDVTGPYVKNPSAYHSPAVPSPGYGYALNSAVAGQDYPMFPMPDSTICVFDSTDLSRNATDPTSTLPSPPRYGTYNTIGYLSGRVPNAPAPPGVTLFQTSQSRLKRVALAGLMYENDYDGFAPPAGKWMDVMTPYQPNSDDYRSPLVQSINPEAYGYALNSAIAGTNVLTVASPANLISFFDSTDLQRNATDPTSTLPNPPRYGAFNTISYVDGHVANP